MLLVTLSVLLTIVSIPETLATCPHLADDLEPWSSNATWPDKKKPEEGAVVNVTKPILLDESPPDLFYINIQSGGRLVWSPKVEINLRVKYILVAGKLEIGSEDCLYKQKTTITLTGNRGDYELSAGEKVILVQDGGTLELHGSRKLSWTKLTKTLPKLSNSGNLLYDHKGSENEAVEKDKSLIVAYTFSINDKGEPTVKDFGAYDLYNRSGNQMIEVEKRLVKHIEAVEEGDVFMMAIQRYFRITRSRFVPNAAFNAFETLVFGEDDNRTSIFQTLEYPQTYATVFQKGYPDSFVEKVGTWKDSIAVLQLPQKNLVFLAASYTAKYWHWQHDNFQVMTIDGYTPLIDVLDDVTSWQTGDRVVFASTDFDWEQAEEKAVAVCEECTNKQLRVEGGFQYTHWGEMIAGAVDERGEVGLLTRNIVIHGELSEEIQTPNPDLLGLKEDTFGGHVKVLKGFADVHIEGVEIYHAGQHTDLGRYPLHFHMCLDTNYTSSPPYLRENSIHHTFARCVTIHGTHGVQVEDNVCYRSRGHSYFLEDGGEMYNSFDGNLAIGTMQGNLIPTDKWFASSFWITNPKNRIRNNVAAGGYSVGFWFVYPIEPTDASRKLHLMEPMEASRTALLEVDNNVAHSNRRWGFNMEERIDDELNIIQTNHFQPLEQPLNLSSKPLDIPISRVTAYKNRQRNIWLEGGSIRASKLSIADSAVGISIFNTNLRQYYGRMSESIVIGESANIGEPTTVDGVTYPRSLPDYNNPTFPVSGFQFYKGPQIVENNWFDGFKNSDHNYAGALSFQFNSIYGPSSVTSVNNVLFGFEDGEATGNRVFFGECGVDDFFLARDGDRANSFRDIDGSVTSLARSFIIKPEHAVDIEGCKLRTNWKMAVCTKKFAKLKASSTERDLNITMVRDDLPGLPLQFSFAEGTGFPVLLGGSKSYTFHFPTKFPQRLDLAIDGIEKDQWVRVGVCLPLGATVNIISWKTMRIRKYEDWKQVGSFAELEDESNDGTSMYRNETTGMVYFKLVYPEARDDFDFRLCPGEKCPLIRILFEKGDRNDADCRSRAYTEEELNKQPAALEEYTVDMPATAASPPAGWGAGPTRPFLNRVPVDGAYGEWTPWAQCSVTCGGGTQTRSRICDSPATANGGSDCVGPRAESQTCGTDPCPVDGGFSEWTSWSTCTETSDCAGLTRRSRGCTSPAPDHGGTYCSGSVAEVEPCTAC